MEAVEAITLRTLCQMWGYKPEEAVLAPAWVLRMTAICSEVDRHEMEKARRQHG